MARAYLGLGSNVGDREAMIRSGLERLATIATIEQCSSLLATKPVGILEQPDFLNAVCRVQTDLSPQELLEKTQEIERQLGRKKTVRFGPRCIDIDILLYDTVTMETEQLTIPHPRIWERDFVIIPLAEVL